MTLYDNSSANGKAKINEDLLSRVPMPTPKKASRVRDVSDPEVEFFSHLALGREVDELFAVVITVTPEIAAYLLERNDNNRSIRWMGVTRSVEEYCHAITRGEWKLNGETIIVSKEGFLNDGQHRLWAIVKTNRSVRALVVFGADRETRMTVDKGSIKTPGDTLRQLGELNNNVLAQALQFVWCRESGTTFNMRPSPQQMQETLNRHPALRDAVHEIYGIKKMRGSQGYIAGAHYSCKRINEKIANEFLTGVLTGVGVASVNSPIARFRDRLARHAANKMADKLPADAQAAIYIKAFNAYRRGKTISTLSWRGRGDGAEAFPVPGA